MPDGLVFMLSCFSMTGAHEGAYMPMFPAQTHENQTMDLLPNEQNFDLDKNFITA
jgi:hypothetical protein